MSALRPQLPAALAPLAVASVLASERPAQAVLVYKIYESGPNVVIETSSSLNLPSSTSGSSSSGQKINPNAARICTGPCGVSVFGYEVTVPADFGTGSFVNADSRGGAVSPFFLGSF